ncbi:unnamed protein product [Aureobasidium pullulans]|nr:unnamed protein product [Aureobasidium pullulans]
MAGSEDESEWEYEYDDHATDDFYLTLDLTTHIPPALARDRRSKAQKSTTRGSNKSLANAPGTGNAESGAKDGADLATQIFLIPPPTDFDPDHVAIRSTPSFDVLGPESSYTTAEGDVIEHSTTKGLRIGLPSTASAQRTSQAKFLETLSAIKARRGDEDAVPVTNIKVYHAPEGWEEERSDYIEKESARSKETRLRLLHDEDGNKLVTRKRRTLARGGSRGGAPSGKRLRQSLGLPEARRDSRPKPRPRKKRKLAAVVEEVVEDANEDTAAEGAASAAGPSQDGASTQAEAEQEDTTMAGTSGTQDADDGAVHNAEGSATQEVDG